MSDQDAFNDHEPVAIGKERQFNMLFPISLDGQRTCKIHLIMSEQDARALAQADDELADQLGELFRAIRDSAAVFLLSEG